jgi:GTP cyclohydrolase I
VQTDHKRTASANGSILPPSREEFGPPLVSAADPSSDPSIDALVATLLRRLGEDPEREGLRDTPRRVRESLSFLTQGYQVTPEEAVGTALFAEEYDQLVLVRDIEFSSLCEHHLLPFFGTVHIGYLPAGRIVGLSKLPRLVDVFARRLQVQERLTRQLAETIQRLVTPLGVGVLIEAHHLCMQMRGVQRRESSTVTSCLLGAFRDDARTRAEFLALAPRGRGPGAG